MNRTDTILREYLVNKCRPWQEELLEEAETETIQQLLDSEDLAEKEYLATLLFEKTCDAIDKTTVIKQMLDEYLRQLCKFERGIVHVMPEYRSHMLHSIYNYLLGFCLEELDQRPYQRLNIGYYDSFDIHRQTCSHPNAIKDEMDKFRERWAYTVFFHDMHYSTDFSYKLINKIAKDITNIKPFFNLSPSELDELLLIPQMAKVMQFFAHLPKKPSFLESNALKIIANRLAFRLENFHPAEIYLSLRQTLYDSLKKGIWDHGLIGAIYNIRTYFTLLDDYIRDQNDPVLRLKLLDEINCFTDAIAAGAIHNMRFFSAGLFRSKPKISHRKLPMAFTLILADEIQEWNRSLMYKTFQKPGHNSTTLEFDEDKKKAYEKWDSQIGKFSKSKNHKRIWVPYFKQPFRENEDLVRSGLKMKSSKTGQFSSRTYSFKSNNKYTEFRFFEAKDTTETEKGKEQLKLYSELWDEYKNENKSVCAFFDFFMDVEDCLLNLCKAENSSSKNKRIRRYRAISALKNIPESIVEDSEYETEELAFNKEPYNSPVLEINTNNETNTKILKTHYHWTKKRDLLKVIDQLFLGEELPKAIVELFTTKRSNQDPNYNNLKDTAKKLIGFIKKVDGEVSKWLTQK
ncbi:MAG TPA: hypothetical protein PLA08_00875 [Candidatus Cloacimonadota bacterium]|nr:hypothetical protein [Candidatus Cloacimonadota bacterium]